MSTKIAQFKVAAAAGKFELDGEVMDFIVECIQKSGLADETVAPAAVASAQAGKTKALTGYNLYMRTEMASLKAKGVATADRMKQVGASWKALDDATKKTWGDKAKGLPEVAVQTKAEPAKKGPKSLTGYQYFMKVQMPVIKKDPAIKSGDRMTKIASLWKLESKESQAEWKAKAAKFEADGELETASVAPAADEKKVIAPVASASTASADEKQAPAAAEPIAKSAPATAPATVSVELSTKPQTEQVKPPAAEPAKPATEPAPAPVATPAAKPDVVEAPKAPTKQIPKKKK